MSHVAPKSMYLGIFGALMVLTVVTVAVAFVNVHPYNFAIALSIAVLKATLVILFFMHAKYASRLTKMFVATSFFFLIILFALTLTDYTSRGLKTFPGGAGGAGFAPASAVEPGRPAGEAHSEGAAEGH
jgi:cytochrome c oxidase subunit IV